MFPFPHFCRGANEWWQADKKKPEESNSASILEELFEPTLEMVQLAEGGSWAQKALGVQDKDLLREQETQKDSAPSLRAAAGNDRITKEHVETQARKALELDPTNCMAQYIRAQSPRKSQDDIIAHSLLA